MTVNDHAAAIAAPGTDPSVLAQVVGGLARPRHGPGRLLAGCQNVDDPRDLPAAMAAATGALDAADRAAAGRLLAAWQGIGVRVALLGDAGYPGRLAEPWPSVVPPALLAWRGQPPGDIPSVAIVGARNATSYGTDIAAWIADAVGAAGARVVSGGAVGVDAAAHRASLSSPGGTTVVLGCGHQVAYPRAHARTGGLFDQVVASAGTVCSELLPFEPPRPGAVRARNRIVAGLADVVVIVEGGGRSGSLLTASAAAEWGRTVLAVPGDVRAPGSQAPHRLLVEGAAPCTGPADVLDALGVDATTAGDAERHGASALDGPLRVIADVWPRAISLDEVAARSDRGIGEVLAVVSRAELDGHVERDGHAVRLVRPAGHTTHGS